jgi:hypothetical protein
MTDTSVAPTTEPMARSSVSERMRRHRQRRRNGFSCYTVQLRRSEVDELVRRGMLQHDTETVRMMWFMRFISFLISTYRAQRL